MIRYYWLRIDGKWRFAEMREGTGRFTNIPDKVLFVWHSDDEQMDEYHWSENGEWFWSGGIMDKINEVLHIEEAVEIELPEDTQ